MIVWKLNAEKNAIETKYTPIISEIKTFPSNSKLSRGWGLAYNMVLGKKYFYATDGSDTIYVIEADTLNTISRINVKDKDNKPLTGLNELEIINTSDLTKNYVFANQNKKNYVYMIDLRSGKVVA